MKIDNIHTGAIFCRLGNNTTESAWQSADGRANIPQLLRDRSATFRKNFLICLKRRTKDVWQSADGRVTSNHCRVTVQRHFTKNFLIAWNVQNVVWQSDDGRATSDQCRVTVHRLFSKNFLIPWNVQTTLFDSRPTVAWTPTTVAWPFSDFFSKIFLIAWNVQKRCLTVGRRSRYLLPESRDRSVTFYNIFPNCLKRPKNDVWQSADGRGTSDHCRVTVQWLFSKIFLIAWNV